MLLNRIKQLFQQSLWSFRTWWIVCAFANISIHITFRCRTATISCRYKNMHFNNRISIKAKSNTFSIPFLHSFLAKNKPKFEFCLDWVLLYSKKNQSIKFSYVKFSFLWCVWRDIFRSSFKYGRKTCLLWRRSHVMDFSLRNKHSKKSPED